MKKSLLALACWLFVSTNPAPAHALGKTLQDPNLLPAAQSPTDTGFWTADTRLSQKLTCEARHKTVLAILNELTTQTGVKLYAGYNSNDWQVRDRKMIIFAQDMQLCDLMQSIARVMKFKWTRTKINNTYTYRLFMDRKTVLEAEADSARAEEKYNREQIKKRETLLDKFKDLSKTDEADLEKLRNESPLLYSLTKSGLTSSLSQLFNDLPGARDAFVGGKELSLSRSQMSEEVQASMIRIAQSISTASPDSPDGQPTPQQLAEDPSRLREIRFYLKDPNEASNITSRFTLGQVAMIYGPPEGSNRSDSELAFPILDPDSSFGKAVGQMLTRTMESGSDDISDSGSFSFNMSAKEYQQGDFGEAVVDHKNEPAITGEVDCSKVKSENPQDQHIDILAEFAQATKLNIVSDCFNSGMGCSFPDKAPAAEVLKTLAQIRESNWWKRESTIELRDRHWFRKRSMEIPEAWLEKWRQALKTTGTLDISDLADMAVLLAEADKYAGNTAGDPVLGTDSIKWTVLLNSRFLRFYAALTPQQRTALYTPNGLDLSTLSKEAKQTMQETVGNLDNTVIKGSRKSFGDKQLIYYFTSQTGASIGQVTTPKYEPPKPTATATTTPAK